MNFILTFALSILVLGYQHLAFAVDCSVHLQQLFAAMAHEYENQSVFGY